MEEPSSLREYSSSWQKRSLAQKVVVFFRDSVPAGGQPWPGGTRTHGAAAEDFQWQPFSAVPEHVEPVRGVLEDRSLGGDRSTTEGYRLEVMEH